jgi:hypothetical protein
VYSGRDLPLVDNNAGQIYGYDLASTLPQGSSIAVVRSGMILESGIDDFPRNHLIGDPEINGTSVTQLLFWGDPPGHFVGNTYVFYLAARTSIGEVIIPWARISVERGFGNSAFIGGASPLAANVFIIPMPGPLFTLPTVGGYSLMDFPDMDQGEQRLCGFDFASLLSPDEVISAVTVSLTVLSGSDPTVDQNPVAYFSGSPIFSGSTAQQLVAIPPVADLLGMPPQQPDLRGVTYAFAISARTSFSQAIVTWSHLRVRSFYA